MWNKIKPITHCKEQMPERNVTQYHLSATVSAYDNWYIQENDRYKFSKKFGGAVLDVIVSATTSASHTIGRVITAFPEDRGSMP